MRGIIRAAAYVPLGSAGGRRSAGPDEDGFTMAATALERLGVAGTVDRLLLAGDLPRTAESDLSLFLGFPVLTERSGTGRSGWDAAVHAALDPVRGTETVVIIAVDLAADSPVQDRPTSSDAAVAIHVGERTGPDLGELPSGSADPDRSATAPILRVGRTRQAEEPDVWLGEWGASPEPGQPVGEMRTGLRTNEPVSQGAYVPRPRYLENLPSRWWFAAEKCTACGTVTFPSRGRCRQCEAGDGLERIRLPRDGGEVVAATLIGRGGQPTEFDAQVESTGPYGVVLVELAPGARVTLQVTDAAPGEVRIGARVATRLRRIYPMEGEWRYGRKAVPLRPSSS